MAGLSWNTPVDTSTLTGAGDPGGGSTFNGNAGENPSSIPGSDSTTTPINTSGGGGFDWSSLIPQAFGGTGSAGNMSMAIPGLAAAAQQYANAGQYTNRAEGYANQLNPFGSQRGQYQDQLAALEKDPSQIANTPGYQFALNQGLGALNRKVMAGQGSVNNADDIQYASGLAQQTYNDRINQLSQLAGAQIGPGAAASMLQTGLTGSIGSQNAALSALMAPFFGQQTQAGGGTPTTTTPTTTSSPGQQPGQNSSGIPNPGNPFNLPGYGVTSNYGGDNTSIGPPAPTFDPSQIYDPSTILDPNQFYNDPSLWTS